MIQPDVFLTVISVWRPFCLSLNLPQLVGLTFSINLPLDAAAAPNEDCYQDHSGQPTINQELYEHPHPSHGGTVIHVWKGHFWH